MDFAEILANEDLLAWLGVGFTFAYFLMAYFALRLPRKENEVRVVRYTPPEGISPGAAAWLLEGGELPRAIAATVLTLAAKGILSIQREDGVYILRRLYTETKPITPEERALMYSWFRTEDTFQLPAAPGELKAAVREFGTAIESVLNPTYYTKNTLLYYPAWILSGMTAVFALYNGNILQVEDVGAVLYVIPYAFLFIWGSLVVSGRGLVRSLKKIATYIPGRRVPRTPLCQGDAVPLGLLSLSFMGILLLVGLSSATAALVVAALLTLNAIFFRALWGPTAEGRAMISEIQDYKKFLAEVDTDPVSRIRWPEYVPLQMNEKEAFAVALGIDLGWGEQFVGAIANWVDSAAVLFSTPDVTDNPKDPFAEMNLK
jgi:Predicted membrane protein (DUF2207)